MAPFERLQGPCAMNDVLFLLLGLGGFAALFGYALFCNRN